MHCAQESKTVFVANVRERINDHLHALEFEILCYLLEFSEDETELGRNQFYVWMLPTFLLKCEMTFLSYKRILQSVICFKKNYYPSFSMLCVICVLKSHYFIFKYFYHLLLLIFAKVDFQHFNRSRQKWGISFIFKMTKHYL